GAEPRPVIAAANNNNEVLQMEKIMRRKVDPLGRIILPAEFRTRLGIEKDSEIEIVCEKDRMIIKKVSPMGVIIPLPRDQ
ncbi:transcriptional regulator, AbrB family, partial [human gut metagenome]